MRFYDVGESPLVGVSERHNPLVAPAIIAGVSALAGNAIGSLSQSKVNKTQIQMNRENNQFNAEQASIQRRWNEEMWNKNNEYNSPSAMISRGINPYLSSTAGSGVSKSPASGGAAATSASMPSLQAFRPDFSSVGSAIASIFQAKKSLSESKQIDTLTPYLANQIQGNTNWKNIGVGQSGYWNSSTGRVSAMLDQSKEAQELNNMRVAANLSAAQTTQIYLQSDAQAVLNKYMDAQQQADLLTKAQYLNNLVKQGILTEAQFKTELQRAINISTQTAGLRISNEISSRTAESIISATNMANHTSYYDNLWDYKNVNNRKGIQYSKDKAIRDYYRWSSNHVKKDVNSYELRNAIDYGTRIFQGIGNTIGTKSR